MKRIVIAILLIVSSALSHAASFDCAKASTRIEKTICGDEQLSKLDSDLMMAYKAAQSSSSDTDKLKSEQKAWLQSSRNKCEDTECIRKAYEDRINALKPVEVSAPVTQTTPETTVVRNESLPDVKPEEKPVEAAAPVVAAEPTPQTRTSESTTASQSTPAGQPTSTVADILFGVAGLVGIALVAGLVRPKWVIRWSAQPTRLKVIGYLLPVLMIVSVAAPMSRTKERAEYDTRIAKESKEKERVAAEAKRQQQQQPQTQTAQAPNVAQMLAGISDEQIRQVCATHAIGAIAASGELTSGQFISSQEFAAKVLSAPNEIEPRYLKAVEISLKNRHNTYQTKQEKYRGLLQSQGLSAFAEGENQACRTVMRQLVSR